MPVKSHTDLQYKYNNQNMKVSQRDNIISD